MKGSVLRLRKFSVQGSEPVAATMNRIHLDVVLVFSQVIILNPVFLQGAPEVQLHPGWRTTIAPTSGHCIDTLCFVGTIVSQGNFFFGFARTRDGLSTLAIAFIRMGFNGQPTSMQLVWHANRNTPVRDNSTLTLTSGNLILQDVDSSIIWSTNVPQGQIVLSRIEIRDWNVVILDSQNRTVWQSFDFPTDTVLPGQVLRRNMSLVAASSPANSSEGSYKMVMESDALVLYAGLLPFWTSPRLAGNATTARIQMKEDAEGTKGVSKFTYFAIEICEGTATSCSETFRAYIGNLADPKYYFLRLDSDGVLRYKYFDEAVQSWNEQVTNDTNPCLHPTSCGGGGVCSLTDPAGKCTCPGAFRYRNPSNARQGCVPAWNATSCENSTIDFLEVHGVSYFANQYLNPTLRDGSVSECKKVCLESCGCAASFFWSDYSVNRSSCFLAFEPLLSMFEVRGELPGTAGGTYVAIVKYVGGDGGGGGSGVSAWKVGVGVLSGGVVLVLVLVFVLVRVRRGGTEVLDSVAFEPKTFSFKEMEAATRKFSKVLGEGGFGTVFEGVLPSGHKVAVKRLENSRQGEKEFTAEVETIALNHLHLVRLWGFCSEGAHRMLVYECMNNGSLDRWLFKSAFLRWQNRYQIAIDTAKGLSYLHEDCRHKILHLDVKPQNILLDDAFRAKVADFGMSKFFDEKKTEVVTNMRGTRGYLAPEWLSNRGVTVKCDVYSYGMVLLELVSGRKNMDVNASSEKYYFPTWAAQRIQEKSWNDVVDARLQGFLDSEDWLQVERVVKIAMWCIQDAPAVRPTMAMVVQMLEGAVEVDDPPLKFDFLEMGFRTEASMNVVSTSTASNQSNSEMMCRRKVIEIGINSFCNPDSNPCVSPR